LSSHATRRPSVHSAPVAGAHSHSQLASVPAMSPCATMLVSAPPQSGSVTPPAIAAATGPDQPAGTATHTPWPSAHAAGPESVDSPSVSPIVVIEVGLPLIESGPPEVGSVDCDGSVSVAPPELSSAGGSVSGLKHADDKEQIK